MDTQSLILLGFAIFFSLILISGLMAVLGRIREQTKLLSSLHARLDDRDFKSRKQTNTPDSEEKFGEIRRELTELKAQQRTPERAPSVGGNQAAYNQAVRMIERGESPEAVREVCGLSRAESELLQKLHNANTGLALEDEPRYRPKKPNMGAQVPMPPSMPEPPEPRAAPRKRRNAASAYQYDYDGDRTLFDDSEYQDTLF